MVVDVFDYVEVVGVFGICFVVGVWDFGLVVEMDFGEECVGIVDGCVYLGEI